MKSAYPLRLLPALTALVLAVGGGTAAKAQEKTPASAYEFIRQNVSDGSWQGMIEHCDNNGEYCSDELSPVRYVMYQNGTYCQLRFSMKGINGPVTRDVDLTKSFSITYWRQIHFSGPVRKTNGEIRSDWQLEPPSYDMGTRVTAALEYLQSVCKPASAW